MRCAKSLTRITMKILMKQDQLAPVFVDAIGYLPAMTGSPTVRIWQEQFA